MGGRQGGWPGALLGYATPKWLSGFAVIPREHTYIRTFIHTCIDTYILVYLGGRAAGWLAGCTAWVCYPEMAQQCDESSFGIFRVCSVDTWWLAGCTAWACYPEMAQQCDESSFGICRVCSVYTWYAHSELLRHAPPPFPRRILASCSEQNVARVPRAWDNSSPDYRPK